MNEFVYCFFGRRANRKFIEDDQEILSRKFSQIPAKPKFEYCQTIERWRLNSDDHEFTPFNVNFLAGVQRSLNPLVVLMTLERESYFVVLGGVKGNQVPVDQICVLRDDFEGPLEMAKYTPGYFKADEPTVKPVDSDEESEGLRSELSVPCSYSCGDFLQDGGLVSTVGFDVAGRPWIT